jgi:hypothetical protein
MSAWPSLPADERITRLEASAIEAESAVDFSVETHSVVSVVRARGGAPLLAGKQAGEGDDLGVDQVPDAAPSWRTPARVDGQTSQAALVTLGPLAAMRPRSDTSKPLLHAHSRIAGVCSLPTGADLTARRAVRRRCGRSGFAASLCVRVK